MTMAQLKGLLVASEYKDCKNECGLQEVGQEAIIPLSIKSKISASKTPFD